MQVFDASSMIHAWDNYPERQFPGLWDWMAKQIEEEMLLVPRVAFEEIVDKMPDCAEWLKGNDVKLLEMTNTIIEEAMRIKQLLGIEGDCYKSGVGENDIFIIATARTHKMYLSSEERRQPKLPSIMANYKIPAVCVMNEVDVSCINFIEFIKGSNVVFR